MVTAAQFATYSFSPVEENKIITKKITKYIIITIFNIVLLAQVACAKMLAVDNVKRTALTCHLLGAFTLPS